MKRLALGLLLSLPALATGPIVVNAPVNHIYVPTGFDNNDNVEVLVAGTFRNTCFSRNKVEVNVVEDLIDVKITSLYQGEECEPLDIPFLEDVTIGSLQAGTYKVRVNQNLTETLTVAEARSTSVDDHLYAPIDYVELGFTGGINGDVFLVGRFSDCLVFDHLELISNKRDTMSILPIMKKIEGTCRGVRTSVSIPVHINMDEFRGPSLLLFVRTLDGKSVHALIER